MKPKLIARAQRFLIGTALLSVVLALFAYRTSTEHVESVEQTLSTVAFIDKVHALFVSVEDAETGQRGYLLTGRLEYLAPFLRAREEMQQKFRDIDAAAAASGIPPDYVRQLHALLEAKMAELQETVDLERAGKHQAAVAVVETDQGFQLMTQIRSLVSGWEETQRRAFQKRLQIQRKRQNSLDVALIATICVTFVFLFLAYRLSSRFAQEREAVEQHIMNLNSTLETRVRERTAELEASAQELEFRSKELERSNADLTEFAYVASHDLQEPLRMVRSYMALLEKRYAGVLDGEAKTFINYAAEGAARMQRLVNDLLQYSSAGTQPVRKQIVSVEELMRNALNNLEVALAENIADVRYDDLPVVWADPGKLTQVFQNLVANAIKFRKPEEPPLIQVSAEQVGSEWQFSVADNGIGFDMAYKDKIFEMFQRLHGNNEYTGSGIGLSICRRIVEQHGGRLWVNSEPGRGTTFHFTIPDSETNGRRPG